MLARKWITRIDSAKPLESGRPDGARHGHVLVVAVAVDRRQHLRVDEIDANLASFKMSIKLLCDAEFA